jgi:hypothetical protein
VFRAGVVDISLLHHLTDHRASALQARNEPGERKISFSLPMLLGSTAVQEALKSLPEIARNQGFVTAL